MPTRPAKPIDSSLLKGDHKPSGKFSEDTPMIAYLHNQSPIKRAKKTIYPWQDYTPKTTPLKSVE
ncbi:Hypothetical predicted protein, partial [Paramuricea clavata]